MAEAVTGIEPGTMAWCAGGCGNRILTRKDLRGPWPMECPQQCGFDMVTEKPAVYSMAVDDDLTGLTDDEDLNVDYVAGWTFDPAEDA